MLSEPLARLTFFQDEFNKILSQQLTRDRLMTFEIKFYKMSLG